jgi:hypothetical protein
MRAEDMSYEDLKAATEGWCVRDCDPKPLPLRPGVFTPVILPMGEVGQNENEKVHWIDYIKEYTGDINHNALANAYVKALKEDNFTEVPEPFGFKSSVPPGTKMQINVYPAGDGNSAYIIKQCIFKNKLKPAVFRQLAYGTPYKLTFEHPKVGVRIWQYAFQNLGGYLYLCKELSAEATNKESKNNAVNLSDKDDAEIDEGFEYIKKHADGMSGVKALLWQTKALKTIPLSRDGLCNLSKRLCACSKPKGHS